MQYEPQKALFSGINGLDDIEVIIQGSRRYLKKNGIIGLEHGYNQGASVRDIFKNFKFSNIKTIQDYAGHDRVTHAMYDN